MTSFTTYSFPATGVLSLCWRGDELVDWVGGARSFTLDGNERPRRVNYAYRFDAATASADGRFAVIFERMGTKGLLLDNGKILRELDRSFYCANAYEYPICIFRDSAGRMLLAHCPEEYCRIELEELETGRPLTKSDERKPSDFFHSRLAVSPGGTRLLSAGWIWRPWSSVVCFDVAQALATPSHLDRGNTVSPSSRFEQGSACWLDDAHVAVGGSAETEDLSDGDEPTPEPNLTPRGLAVYDITQRRCILAFELSEPPGTMVAIDRHRVLSLYRHPKLIDLTTGQIVHVWTDLNSGLQDSSIIWGLKDQAIPPPMTFDPICRRFAIFNGDAITIIEFPSEQAM